ncbi:MAG TPA: BON domain-containing protein [Sandaracinaceae bacterium]
MRPSRRTGDAHASHLLAALAVGAAGAWLLDPVQGQRRRAALRHWLGSRGRALARFAGKGGRDLRNRAIGTIAEARGRLAEGAVPDDTLGERVRAALGHACSHPSAIDVEVQNGCVVLGGPVLAAEHHRLLRTVSGVRGVRAIEDHLELHASPDGVPALQGGVRRPARGRLQPRPGTALLGAAIALGAGALGARRARSRLSSLGEPGSERPGRHGSHASGRAATPLEQYAAPPGP